MDLDSVISEITSNFSSKTPKYYQIPYSPEYLTLIHPSLLLLSNYYTLSLFDLAQKKITSEKTLELKILSFALSPSLLFLSQNSSICKFTLPDLTLVETLTQTDDVTCLKYVKEVLISGSNDFSVRILDLSALIGVNDRVLYTHDDKVRALDADPELKFVVSLGYEGFIKVFNYQKSLEVCKLDCCYSSYVCKISDDCKFLMSTENRFLFVWDMEGFSRTDLSTHDRDINDLEVFGEFCYSCSSDRTIRKTELNNLQSSELIRTEDTINWLCVGENEIYAALDNNSILVINDSELVGELAVIAGQSNVHCFSKLHDKLLVFTEGKELKIVEIPSFQIIKTIDLQDSINSVYALNDVLLCTDTENQIFFMDDEGTVTKTTNIFSPSIATYNNQFAVLFSGFITIYNYPELDELSKYPRNSSVCTISLHDPEIFFAEYNGEIKVINSLDINKKPNSLIGHNTNVLCIQVSRDKKFLVSSDLESIFIIWDMEVYSILRKISHCFGSIFYFTQDLNYLLIFSQSSFLIFLSLENFEIITKVKTKYEIKDGLLSDSEDFIFLQEIDELNYIKNPLKSQILTAVGGYLDETAFMNYILSLQSSFKYEPNMDSWLILPHNLNALHFYAYFNYSEALLTSISTEGAVLKSTSNHSVLSISLQRNFDQCVRAVYKGLVKRINSNPFILTRIEDDLVHLNNSNFPNAFKFYNIFLQESNQKIPKFCSSSISLPVIQKFPKALFRFSWDPEESSDLTQAVKYLQSFVGVSVEVGSVSSIQFLQSLVNCNNSEIFNCRLIQVILEDKWEQLKVYLYIESFVHVCYLTLISVYASYDRGGVLVSAFVMNCALFVYEVWKVLASRSFFKRLKNALEILNFGLIFSFCVIVWSGGQNSRLFGAVMFFSWLRGLSIFRLFTSTRYYINLLRNVLADIGPFFLIFTYSVVGFGLVFQALDGDNTVYFDYLTGAYTTVLGSENTGGYDMLHWLVLLLITVLNQIVMLNLIISIMSDTYSRVQETSLQADSIELTNMLIEVETMMFWQRLQTKKSYFFLCEQGSAINQTQSLTSKLKKLKSSLSIFKAQVTSNNLSYQSSLQEITQNSSQTHMSLLALSQKLQKPFK